MHRVLVLCLVACAAGPERVGTQPSWRHAPVGTGPVTTAYAPTSPPAQHYNEPVQPPEASPLDDAVIAAVRAAADRAHLPAPVPDARLFRASAELAEVVPEDGAVDFAVETWLLQRQGVLDEPRLYTTWTTDSKVEQITSGLGSALDEIVSQHVKRYGIGTAQRKADGTIAVVFVAVTSELDTAPIPRWLADNASFTLEGAIDPGDHDPELWYGRDDGLVDQVKVDDRGGGRFQATISCAHRHGRQQIELEAVGPSGPTTLTNFALWCGGPPPDVLPKLVPPEDLSRTTTQEVEHGLYALINRDRTAAGLPPLAWDDKLADVARGHSAEMEKTRTVAHWSPTTGTVADRTKAAGIKTLVVLENVARGFGIASVHDGLMTSPAHRANIMHRAATNVGIGVAFHDSDSGRELYVTQVFTRVTPRIDPAKAKDVIAQRIRTVRPVAANPLLASVADEYVQGLVAGQKREELADMVKKRTDALARSFASVNMVTTVVADLDAIDAKQLVGDYKADDIGIGIVQAPHPDLGDNAIWVVVLMAQRVKP
ncbi:MAG TPA: CAP domain-containing protein [Kofleriaceae bacterium]|nr:CAP domain-containing protein [Kofleriaceae bacterium]